MGNLIAAAQKASSSRFTAGVANLHAQVSLMVRSQLIAGAVNNETA